MKVFLTSPAEERHVMQTLWRAAPERDPWFGFCSWWTPNRPQADYYRTTPGFGGPVLYRVDVDPDVLVLDLRPDPWPVVAERFGLDREDYGPGELDHEIIWGLAATLAAHGHLWVVLPVRHPSGIEDEWLYLGPAHLPAVRV